MRQVHAAPWPERYAVVKRFMDKRYREFGLRIIYAEAPQFLPETERDHLGLWQRARIDGAIADAVWITKAKALAEFDSLSGSASDGLRDWLTAR